MERAWAVESDRSIRMFFIFSWLYFGRINLNQSIFQRLGATFFSMAYCTFHASFLYVLTHLEMINILLIGRDT